MLDMFGQDNAATIIHYVVTVIDPCYAVFGGLYYIGRVCITTESQLSKRVYSDNGMSIKYNTKFGTKLLEIIHLRELDFC